VIRCPPPGGESGVLGVAAEMLLIRLPRDRPLWAATLVTDASQGEAALIIVFHHVLADGMGGLAVLASLVDGAPDAHDCAFPVRMPSRRQLAVQAATDRLRSVGKLPAVLGRLRGAASQLRPVFTTRLGRSSLDKPTGPRRRFASVRVDLSEIRSAGHAHQATVNDIVLSAIAAALHRLLLTRGERVDNFVISVPFSARRQASASDLGNHSAVIPLLVSGVGDPDIDGSLTVNG
jgi:diacylglycerol O-acyltransferase / wax synthase